MADQGGPSTETLEGWQAEKSLTLARLAAIDKNITTLEGWQAEKLLTLARLEAIDKNITWLTNVGANASADAGANEGDSEGANEGAGEGAAQASTEAMKAAVARFESLEALQAQVVAAQQPAPAAPPEDVVAPVEEGGCPAAPAEDIMVPTVDRDANDDALGSSVSPSWLEKKILKGKGRK